MEVQYATGKIGEVKGYPCDITTEEIAAVMPVRCGIIPDEVAQMTWQAYAAE